ncbi:DsbA family protein [Sphingorhabdus sp.]|jgi:protein-disulfide isomerase|uniref:DsbA family protein n=1 Tax=Sphingorhabdus sp. TaxID=1902408 RepID=UPI0037C73F93
MNNMTSRTPLILILSATLLLAAIGACLFWPEDSMSVQEPAGAASEEAAKAVAAAGMSADDRKATEAIVRAYVLENPEIITEAIGVLQKREATQRLSAAGSKLTEPFPGAEFGNPNGDVTLVEFTDYNCGYCRSSVADVQKLIDSDSNIRVVIRELPILSASSRDAALWALAAAKQGKHKAFHDAMFSGGRPDAQSIRAAASKAGMNLAAAEKFARSSEAMAEVESNIAIMQQVGFGGTPTFIVGDQILEGAVGFDALKAAVAKARKAA